MREKKKYEARDANVKALILFGVALTMVVTISSSALLVWHNMLEKSAIVEDERKHTLRGDDMRAPDPQLEVHPSKNYEDFKRAEDAMIHTYGWIDREKKIVRIPVEQAIRRQAKGKRNA